MEHRVGVWRERGRVIKDYNTSLFDSDTGYPLYKPAELLFDYLTDHLLANHVFDDDVCLEGFYEENGNVHTVISQPYIKGRHPAWASLVRLLEMQGLEHASPGTSKARFLFEAGMAGRILITDAHEDNVLVSRDGMAHPIDVHFSFPSRQARLDALQTLGIL